MASFEFDPDRYGEVCSELLSSERLPSLGPGHPDRAADRLRGLTPERLFDGPPLANPSMGLCCLSGLWLWFDQLDTSHGISQQIDTTSGSYWHGMMHRREPDYSNAKYWFRAVGDHPIYNSLAVAAAELIGSTNALQVDQVLSGDATWDPYRFVDLCQRHVDTGSPVEYTLRQIARAEWQLLFDYCYRAATK
jgi:hypothetical protein